jgi:hypothetical protein
MCRTTARSWAIYQQLLQRRRAGLADRRTCRSSVRADAGTRTPDPLLTMQSRGRALWQANPAGQAGLTMSSARRGSAGDGARDGRIPDGFGPKSPSWAKAQPNAGNERATAPSASHNSPPISGQWRSRIRACSNTDCAASSMHARPATPPRAGGRYPCLRRSRVIFAASLGRLSRLPRRRLLRIAVACDNDR